MTAACAEKCNVYVPTTCNRGKSCQAVCSATFQLVHHCTTEASSIKALFSCSSRLFDCSSGILLDLLSPQASTGLDGLAASAILVSKSDAPSVVGVARNTPTKLKQAGGEADGDWHLL